MDSEGTHANDQNRYFAAAVRRQAGPLLMQATLDTTNRGSQVTASDKTNRDPMSFGVQASYNFGFLKLPCLKTEDSL